MNYLVHLYLSDPEAECQLGSLMGDFVKGAVDPGLPAGYRRGIALHRRIDSFAQNDPIFRRSKRRLDDSFGHCKGIMIDVFYDHFLARNWDLFSPLPLEVFARRVYGYLERDFASLPPGLQRIAPLMIRQDWLFSYREMNTIGRVLARLSARLRRPNPVADGLAELRCHYEDLQSDFFEFLPAATVCVRNCR